MAKSVSQGIKKLEKKYKAAEKAYSKALGSGAKVFKTGGLGKAAPAPSTKGIKKPKTPGSKSREFKKRLGGKK